MNHLVYITKSDGTSQLFEEGKLVSSLKRVGASDDVIDDIVKRVGEEIKPNMSTAEIYRRAFELLHKHSSPVAIKYSLRRAITDLGPDGFPFEQYVSRIFKLWGYETMTDQIVRGHCVEHEVDVVAWKDDSLAMVEAKFHNEFGLKSDLKVALYVKARYDDLVDIKFNFGDKERVLSEKWLVTNTKFTDRAIQYGSCANLKMIGWNYPAKGNLHEIIEQNGLHPVTVLMSLSVSEKKILIGEGVLTCIDLVNNSSILTKVGLTEDKINNVITESKIIVERAK